MGLVKFFFLTGLMCSLLKNQEKGITLQHDRYYYTKYYKGRKKQHVCILVYGAHLDTSNEHFEYINSDKEFPASR